MIKTIKKIFKERIILASAITIIGLSSSLFAITKTVDFTENNPKFCITCHLM